MGFSQRSARISWNSLSTVSVSMRQSLTLLKFGSKLFLKFSVANGTLW